MSVHTTTLLYDKHEKTPIYQPKSDGQQYKCARHFIQQLLENFAAADWMYYFSEKYSFFVEPKTA